MQYQPSNLFLHYEVKANSCIQSRYIIQELAKTEQNVGLSIRLGWTIINIKSSSCPPSVFIRFRPPQLQRTLN